MLLSVVLSKPLSLRCCGGNCGGGTGGGASVIFTNALLFHSSSSSSTLLSFPRQRSYTVAAFVRQQHLAAASTTTTRTRTTAISSIPTRPFLFIQPKRCFAMTTTMQGITTVTDQDHTNTNNNANINKESLSRGMTTTSTTLETNNAMTETTTMMTGDHHHHPVAVAAASAAVTTNNNNKNNNSNTTSAAAIAAGAAATIKTPAAAAVTANTTTTTTHDVPLYRAEGIFAVYKPLNWTSNDVVSYIRGILERDARTRGIIPQPVGGGGGGSRRRNNNKNNNNKSIKVGHGGTLDPLATGVLVVGVGVGTKQMSSFLSGSKRYVATAELGYETTTLDTAGTMTQQKSWDHVTPQALENALSHFRGSTLQIPPMYSAIRKHGQRLYEQARQGKTADDIQLEARPVEIYHLEWIDRSNSDSDGGEGKNKDTTTTSTDTTTTTSTTATATTTALLLSFPKFRLSVECGGGTYIRSLVRDIGYQLDTVANMIQLERTKQGPFTISDTLSKEYWTADHIYDAIEKCNDRLGITTTISTTTQQEEEKESNR